MKMKRFFAGLAAAAMAAAMMAVPASASAAPAPASTDFTYTGVAGGPATYHKYLVMPKNAACPAVTFNYTIEPGAAANATDTDHIDVYAGIAGAIVSQQAVFTSASTVTDGAANDGIAMSTEKKFATADLIVDFSGVTFPEPGVYRYVLTEAEPTGAFSNNTALAKTLDVYVVDSNDGHNTLSVNSYVLYDKVINTAFAKTDVAPNPIDSAADTATYAYTVDGGNKTNGYVNEFTTHNIVFKKTVTGNQASRDKFFKFTITINGVTGATVNVVGKNGTFTGKPSGNNATEYTATQMETNDTDDNASLDGQQLVANADGVITHDFYLQDGDYVTITGVPEGASYTITEVNEDYKPAIQITGDTQTGDSANDSGAAIDTEGEKNTYTDTYLKYDTTAAFTNDRTGTVPTGVILSIAAPCVIGVAVISGLVIMNIKKKKDESEE